MKTYLAQFTIYDGEHEHGTAFVLKAESREEAITIATSREHDTGYPKDDEHLTYWDYGDGQTAAQVDEVREITQEEADTLDRLGLAYYFN